MYESESKWQVGDRVVLIDNEPCGNLDLPIGSTGTICSVFSHEVGVCWDHKIRNGHDCATSNGARCEMGYGWYVFDTQIAQETEDDSDIEIDEAKFIGIIWE